MTYDTEPDKSMLSEEHEHLLARPMVIPPADFTRSVLAQVTYEKTLAADTPTLATESSLGATDTSTTHPSWWQWLALLASAVVGAGQLTAFIFGAWVTTAAG